MLEARLACGADVVFEPHRKPRPSHRRRCSSGTLRPVGRFLCEAGVQGVDVEELRARIPPLREALLR